MTSVTAVTSLRTWPSGHNCPTVKLQLVGWLSLCVW